MIKIRMARGGRVHKPIFTIVATDSRNPRDGRFLQKLGSYDPSSEQCLNNINKEAIEGWMKEGAVMSDTVRTLLKKNKVEINL